MKTVTTTLYKFDELPTEQAKERAREWWRENDDGYPWADEAIKSLEAFAEHFDARLRDYSVDFQNTSYSSADFTLPEYDAEDPADLEWLAAKIQSLRTVATSDNWLTGYCADLDAIDGAIKAYEAGERDLDAILQAGFDTWLKSAQADAEALNEDEAVDDTLTANEYDFTEDGRRWTGKE